MYLKNALFFINQDSPAVDRVCHNNLKYTFTDESLTNHWRMILYIFKWKCFPMNIKMQVPQPSTACIHEFVWFFLVEIGAAGVKRDAYCPWGLNHWTHWIIVESVFESLNHSNLLCASEMRSVIKLAPVRIGKVILCTRSDHVSVEQKGKPGTLS